LGKEVQLTRFLQVLARVLTSQLERGPQDSPLTDLLQEIGIRLLPFKHDVSNAVPAIFKWRHFTPAIILCVVRWCLRYSLSYRDVQELLVERGMEVEHTSVWRWIQRYAPELEERT
jgi:hypothetical protein